MREDYSRFAGLLKDKGITAYRVSKETGVPASALTNWKKGVCKPKVDKMKRIADFLGCPLEYLL